jgi:hypothetical protein
VNFPGQKRRAAHEVKDAAKRQCFRAARAIVEEHTENLPEEQRRGINAQKLANCANAARRNDRPGEPLDLNFELELEHVPRGFQHLNIRVPETDRRHLLFLSRIQRQLLRNRLILYTDGTFKVVRAPFVQLYSVHATLKKDGLEKQYPFCFLCMSGKARQDYEACFINLRNPSRL